MHSENTGKLFIEELSRKKGKVSMCLSNDEIIEINEDIVLEFYLYEKKELSFSEIKKIKESAEMSETLNKAYNLLAHGLYTKKEVKERLLRKKCNPYVVDKVIKKLISLNYLNDKIYLEEYLSYAKTKGYGPKKIKSELIKKGINDALIASISFDDQEEIIETQAEKLLKKYQNLNYQKKYQKIYNHLLLLGYSSSLISDVLENKIKLDGDKEIEILRKDMEKAINKFKNKFIGNDLKKVVITYLMKKGYKYDTIYEVLKEYDFYED
ncbi:MAG: RecX family transcriptional regulator [Erysipelotrichales bacterium]|nr:RecX family transcriptional regulator [Erysipelotrichales bacterium]